MLLFEAEATVSGSAQRLWDVWTDVAQWAQWDPHSESARLEGEFRVGGGGYAKPRKAPGGEFTLVEVQEPAVWVSRSELPGGELRFTHMIETLADGQAKVAIRAEGKGPFARFVKLGWGRRMSADAPLTLAALAKRAA